MDDDNRIFKFTYNSIDELKQIVAYLEKMIEIESRPQKDDPSGEWIEKLVDRINGGIGAVKW
jgi:hypothetical protein